MTEVFLTTGPDPFLFEEHVIKYKKASQDKYGEINVIDIDLYDILSTQEVKNEILSPPFFGGKKIVFLRNFPPPAQPILSESKKKEYEGLLTALFDLPDGVVVFCNSLNPDKRSRFYKTLQKNAKQVWECKAFDEKKEIPQWKEWIIEEGKKYGILILQPQATLLLNICGYNLFSLHQEIKKLSLYRPGKNILDQDIIDSTIPQVDIPNFAFSDALATQKLSRIIEVLKDLFDEFDPIMVLNRDIIPTLRNLLQARLLLDLPNLKSDCSLHPFVLNTTKKIVECLTLNDIQLALKEILEIDEMMKDGRIRILTGESTELIIRIEQAVYQLFKHKK